VTRVVLPYVVTHAVVATRTHAAAVAEDAVMVLHRYFYIRINNILFILFLFFKNKNTGPRWDSRVGA
jgi:hypothetical protein